MQSLQAAPANRGRAIEGAECIARYRAVTMLYRLLACVFVFGAVDCLTAAVPTTQPSSGDSAAVLVLPFTAPAAAQYEWIGRGVQQDLLADLTPHVRGAVAAPGDASPASDAPPALQAARTRGASIVVFGSAQAIGDQLRLTGQVVDVASGKPLAGLKATGTIETVFRLEDALAAQVIRAVPERLLTRQSLGMLRRDSVPATFAAAPTGGFAYAAGPTITMSPMQPLNAPLDLSMPYVVTSPYPYWLANRPPRGPNPPAYPLSYYRPYLSSYDSPDIFLLFGGRHRR